MWESGHQGQWPQQQAYGYQTPAAAPPTGIAGAPITPGANMFDNNTDIYCDHCKQHLIPGVQWHCSFCAGGDFDLCDTCRRNGVSCFCGTGLFQLTIIQGYGRERGVHYAPSAPFPGSQAPVYPTPAYPTPSTYPPTTAYPSYTSAPAAPSYMIAPAAPIYGASREAPTGTPFTPPYSPPVSATASHTPYASIPPTSSQPLSSVLPNSATLKDWTANPSLNAFLSRFMQYTKSTQHTNPVYESIMCKTPEDYDAWLKNTHEPQDQWHEQIITCLTDLNESISMYIELKARSGLDIWAADAYPTKDGEVCDCFDIMGKVHQKIDELRKMQQDHQDDNNRQWVGSRGAQTEEDVKKLIALYTQAATENRINGAKAQMQRRIEFADLIRRMVTKADEKERIAFETVLAATSNAIASGVGNDRDTLVKAVEVLGTHLEVRRSMQLRLAQAAMEQVAAEHGYKVTQITEEAEEEALVQEGNRRLDEVELARDEILKKLADEWDFRVNKPIIPVVTSMSGGAQPTTSTGRPLYNPPTTSTSAASGGTGSRSVTISRSIGFGHGAQATGPIPSPAASAPAPDPAVAGGYAPPLSFYSNMLHQQHVVGFTIPLNSKPAF